MPAIAFGQPTWIDEILTDMETRLATIMGFDKSRVFTSFVVPEEHCQMPTAERFVTLQYESLNPVQASVTGGGAQHTVFDSVIAANMVTRLATGQMTSDANTIRDGALGVSRDLKALCSAVQVWANIVGTKSRFKEPSRLLSARLNPRKTPAGWSVSQVRIQVVFVAELKAEGGL